MSQYYLGDPCYVIPDAEWGDFCSIMRDDGEDFEYKGETCRVVGTGGDGDFGGLSVDAGIIGVIPVVLCDPKQLKDTVPTHARLIDNFAELEYEEGGGFIIVDGECLNGVECECNYCSRSGGRGYYSEDQMIWCNCGVLVSPDCVHYGADEKEYCSEDCEPEGECDYCSNNVERGESVCDDCLHHSVCGCEKDDPSDDEDQCASCRKTDE